MPKGGARVNSGPPPDPNALRRDRPSDKDGWTTLPADGRRGDPPDWPLPPEVRLSAELESVTDAAALLAEQIEDGTATRGAAARLARAQERERVLRATIRAAEDTEILLWIDAWHTPQAVMWERLRWTREVALYVRLQVLAELGDINAGKEARQWSDRLGLNPAAMLRNRWKIDGPAPALPAKPAARPAAPRRSRRPDARARLQSIKGGR